METVLITGAASGLGLEFAKQYAARGATVIATHRRRSPPPELETLADRYATVQVTQMDLLDHTQIDSVAGRMKERPIDILLNCAALIEVAPLATPGADIGQKFGSLRYDTFDRFMRTNVAAPIKVSEAFLEHVKSSRLKRIVAISSAGGSLSVQRRSAELFWYRSSKSALNSVMRQLAVQLAASGIIVTLIHPGIVKVERLASSDIVGISPAEAVTCMITTIDQLTTDDSGRFLQNDGKAQPW